jgi:hypothetical protein
MIPVPRGLCVVRWSERMCDATVFSCGRYRQCAAGGTYEVGAVTLCGIHYRQAEAHFMATLRVHELREEVRALKAPARERR